MARVVTDQGAVNALVFSAEILAVSMRKAEAGVAVGQARARVDRGEMKRKIHAVPRGRGRVRVQGDANHTIFNEFGTRRGMSAQPMLRPAMEASRAAS